MKLKQWELAYKDKKKGLTYDQIAAKYKVTKACVRSWQTRHFSELELKESEQICNTNNDMREDESNMHNMQSVSDSTQSGTQTSTQGIDDIDTTKPIDTMVDGMLDIVENHVGIDSPPLNEVNKRVITYEDMEKTLVNDEYNNLEIRQRQFVDEYVLTKNASQSYLKAYGCRVSTAGVQGSRLLDQPKIARIIGVRAAERAAAAHVDAEYVLINAKEVIARCMQASPVMIFDKAQRKYVQATGENGQTQWQFDSKGANQALELVSKILGITQDNHKLTIEGGISLANMSTDDLIREFNRQKEISNTIDVTPQISACTQDIAHK